MRSLGLAALASLLLAQTALAQDGGKYFRSPLEAPIFFSGSTGTVETPEAPPALGAISADVDPKGYRAGANISIPISASGGTGILRFLAATGISGLLADDALKVVHGSAPSFADDYRLSLTVEDSTTPTKQTRTDLFDLVVNPAFVVEYPLANEAVLGAQFTLAPTIAGAMGEAVSWTPPTAEVLPTGLTVDPITGVISGVPTAEESKTGIVLHATSAYDGIPDETVPFSIEVIVPISPEWVSELVDATSSDERHTRVSAAADGSTYLAGHSGESSNPFRVAKLKPTGEIDWAVKVQATGWLLNLQHMVSDASGVYLIGLAVNQTNGRGADYGVIKLSPSGAILWQGIYGHASNVNEYAFDAHTDGQRLLVFGNTTTAAGGLDGMIASIDASTGALNPETRAFRTSDRVDEQIYYGTATASGVYVVGNAENAAFAAKFSSDLSTLVWKRKIVASFNPQGIRATANEVVLVGVDSSMNGFEILRLPESTGGTTTSTGRTFSSGGKVTSATFDVDPSGNVYAAALGPASSYVPYIFKALPNGTAEWGKSIQGKGARIHSIDHSGNQVALGGWTSTTDGTNVRNGLAIRMNADGSPSLPAPAPIMVQDAVMLTGSTSHGVLTWTTSPGPAAETNFGKLGAGSINASASTLSSTVVPYPIP